MKMTGSINYKLAYPVVILSHNYSAVRYLSLPGYLNLPFHYSYSPFSAFFIITELK